MRARLVWLVAAALLAVGCGQRPGTFTTIGAGGPGTGTAATGSDGLGPGAGDAAGVVGGAAGESAAGAGAAEGGVAARGQQAAGDAVGDAGRQIELGPVWGKEIVIGIHAPVTGAASLKADAFEAGRELYWKFLDKRGVKVHGRSVKVIFEDDKYNPSTAATLCKQMVQGSKAFMLVGVAGADQIVECARYAATEGVPYLSSGTTENVVSKLPNYFGFSASYAGQAPLLAAHLKTLAETDKCRSQRVGTCTDPTMRVGLIVSDTPNFDDAHEGFQAAFKKEFGRDVDYFKVVSKEPSQQEAAQQAAALRQWNNTNGIDVVYILSSVTFVVNLAAALDDTYRPRFVGVGITMVNQGVDLACAKGSAFEGARYYNPVPAWADHNLDPDFNTAVSEQGHQGQNVPNGGDLMWGQWTISRVIHKALEAAGPQLSRGGFIRALEGFKYSERKAYPDLTFTPANRFGTSQAHLLEAKCQVQNNTRGQFHTIRKAWE